MCAEELTNQVLYMRNVPAGEKDIWMTFEAIEDGELGKWIHSTLLKRKPLSLQTKTFEHVRGWYICIELYGTVHYVKVFLL